MRLSVRKPVLMSVAAAAVIAGAAALSMLPRHAAAEGDTYINAVDLDIKPGEISKFLELVKENGANAVKEPGCREFNITASRTDPHHVFLFEVYENEAALTAHRNTDHFKKFAAGTASLVVGRNVRAFSAVAFNSKEL